MSEFLRFTAVEKKLRAIREGNLPGSAAQYLMAPLGRQQTRIDQLDHKSIRHAAVLMLLMNSDDRPKLILTRRTEYAGVHSGQISLPGGKMEDDDPGFLQTALRETQEEIGVAPGRVNVMGSLSELYIPPSNFLVRPFIGTTRKIDRFVMEEAEVQEVIAVDLNVLFDPATAGEYYVQTHGYRLKVPAYKVDNHIIWGATAMMISELRALLQ